MVCAAPLTHTADNGSTVAEQVAEAPPQRGVADSVFLVQKLTYALFREELNKVQPRQGSAGPRSTAVELEQPSAREPKALCADSTETVEAVLRSIRQPVARTPNGRGAEALPPATTEQPAGGRPNGTAVVASWARTTERPAGGKSSGTGAAAVETSSARMTEQPAGGKPSGTAAETPWARMAEQPAGGRPSGPAVKTSWARVTEQPADGKPNGTAAEGKPNGTASETFGARMRMSLLGPDSGQRLRLEKGEFPREPRSRTFGLAVVFIGLSLLACLGICCVQTGLCLQFAAKVQKESYVYSKDHKDEADNPFLLHMDEASALTLDMPGAPYEPKLPSIAFAGSARGLGALAAGEASELLLGPVGEVTLCVALESVPGGRGVKVERIHQGHRTPMCVCHSKDGEAAWTVCDTARTFTGYIRPLPTANKDVSYCGLMRGSFDNARPDLIVERPVRGRPPCGATLLSAITTSGRDAGCLTVNEDKDTVEVSVVHSAMDSMVVLSLVAVYLLGSEIQVETDAASEGSDVGDAIPDLG